MSMPVPYIAHVASVEFKPLSDREIEDQSHVLVTSQDTFASDKTPKNGGILDGHLGTIDYAYECQSCKNNRTDCPGHKGHMKLNFPVFSPLFIDTVVRWLKIICHDCKNLIRPSASLTNTNFAGKKCNHCGAVQPRINKGKPAMWLIFKTAENPEGVRMYPYQLRSILEGISDKILKQLKVPLESHPSKFILSNITVTSVVTRPDVKKVGGGSRSSNDKVTAYFHLLANKNSRLPLSIPQEIPDKLLKDYNTLSFLYYNCVKGGMNGGDDFSISMASSPTREEGARDAILRHLVSKAGHIRGNMLGKPTFYMMRSVITGDPTIKVDDLYIPFEFAQIIQIPETVQHYNYDIMLTYFLNGKSGKYPRCVKIDKKSTGKTRFTNKLTPDVKLEIGDVVWRDLIDGDEVIFNRQPSLYYASMNKHKIKVSRNPDAKTFRMSELACAPYGADFRPLKSTGALLFWLDKQTKMGKQCKLIQNYATLVIA